MTFREIGLDCVAAANLNRTWVLTCDAYEMGHDDAKGEVRWLFHRWYWIHSKSFGLRAEYFVELNISHACPDWNKPGDVFSSDLHRLSSFMAPASYIFSTSTRAPQVPSMTCPCTPHCIRSKINNHIHPFQSTPQQSSKDVAQAVSIPSLLVPAHSSTLLSHLPIWG